MAVIGKPNAGKSSLVNKILGEERVIVSNVAGTTRDAIDSYFENDQGRFVFIDTAGIRRKSKVEEDIEKYSVLRATLAIERSDVCLIPVSYTHLHQLSLLHGDDVDVLGPDDHVHRLVLSKAAVQAGKLLSLIHIFR